MALPVIAFKVNGTALTLVRGGPFTAGSKYRCHFTFSKEWDGFPVRMATFWSDPKQPVIRPLKHFGAAQLERNSCIMPELLKSEGGLLYIGVFGMSGGKKPVRRISTQLAALRLTGSSWVTLPTATAFIETFEGMMEDYAGMVAEAREKIDAAGGGLLLPRGLLAPKNGALTGTLDMDIPRIRAHMALALTTPLPLTAGTGIQLGYNDSDPPAELVPDSDYDAGSYLFKVTEDQSGGWILSAAASLGSGSVPEPPVPQNALITADGYTLMTSDGFQLLIS